jgi:hypothetical protein
VTGEREIVGRSAIVFLRARAIQRSRHVGFVRAKEQPYPKAKEGHHGGDGVEEMDGGEVPGGTIVHFPFGVMTLGIDVEIRRICPRQSPVMAHFACGIVRRGIRHKKRKKDDQKGCHGLTSKEGLGVEGVAPHGEAARQLEGGGVAGGHCHGHFKWWVCGLVLYVPYVCGRGSGWS